MRSRSPPLPDSPIEGRYRINIDGHWDLADLYVFPRAFEQAYYLFYSLLPDHDEWDVERIEHAYSSFPWQGGYSAVNFYNQLKHIVPQRQRPELISFNYASPGVMELGLILAVAITVGRIVKSVASSINDINSTYTNIIRGMQERNIMRIEGRRRSLNLHREELDFIQASLSEMSKILGFENIRDINERTGNPYVSLKILLSLYRRVRTLGGYEREGKAVFPDSRRDRRRDS